MILRGSAVVLPDKERAAAHPLRIPLSELAQAVLFVLVRRLRLSERFQDTSAFQDFWTVDARSFFFFESAMNWHGNMYFSVLSV